MKTLNNKKRISMLLIATILMSIAAMSSREMRCFMKMLVFKEIPSPSRDASGENLP